MKQRHLIYLSLLLLSSLNLHSQTETYNQIYSEFQFSRAINNKWAAELYIGSAFSNTPSNKKILSTNIQRYISGWAHYYFSPRWKFTAGLAYYYNKDVPDIGQYLSHEIRLILQANYYIHKTGYVLSTRMRGEMRYMTNEEGVFKDQYRYRQMLKYLQPLNSRVMRKGVIYMLVSEELLFRPKVKTKGITFFDRNRCELGLGYLFTDDFQVELSYANEYIPRDDVDEIYNGLQLTLTFNNLLQNLRRNFSRKSQDQGDTN